ncbi:MAG TPA: hypothetical protein VE974_23150 [Thermoanaerobaculia bacterium]|nr:hypothetical protein [Thermoanaerobaculia bacterium]
MNKLPLVPLILVGLAVLFMPASASAQSKVCVYAQHGYSAQARVVSGDWSSDWTRVFDIGSGQCIDISNLADSAKYRIEVQAIGGGAKECTPKYGRYAARPWPLVYFTNGSTTMPNCFLVGE